LTTLFAQVHQQEDDEVPRRCPLTVRRRLKLTTLIAQVHRQEDDKVERRKRWVDSEER